MAKFARNYDIVELEQALVVLNKLWGVVDIVRPEGRVFETAQAVPRKILRHASCRYAAWAQTSCDETHAV